MGFKGVKIIWACFRDGKKKRTRAIYVTSTKAWVSVFATNIKIDQIRSKADAKWCYNIGIKMVFHALTFARSLGGVVKRGRRPRFLTPPKGLGEWSCIEKACSIDIIAQKLKTFATFCVISCTILFRVFTDDSQTISADYARSRAWHYTSRNGSTSVARYDHTESCVAVH